MPSNSAVQQIMQAPNVLGYVHCSESGDIIVQEGNEVDVLANVLIYFNQMATLIGESFGLEGFHEAQIQSKSLIVLCMPHQGGAIGVIVNARARVSDVAALMKQIVEGA